MMRREGDIELMRKALSLANKARELGEVPVGAIIVDGEGCVLARAYNLRESKKSASAHAELLAIERACRKIGDWRLSGCTLYVTLEPCPMCAGAIVNSRIKRVVFGAYDMQAGCCGSLINLNAYPFNHAFEIEGGVLEDECKAILASFFEERRDRKKTDF